MKFGATLRAAAESARLHAHADHLVPYDELKAALRQPALPGPAFSAARDADHRPRPTPR